MAKLGRNYINVPDVINASGLVDDEGRIKKNKLPLYWQQPIIYPLYVPENIMSGETVPIKISINNISGELQVTLETESQNGNQDQR